MMNTQDFYRAFIERDSHYDGLFFAGIKTTGIFCRPTCSARKPKIENCDFFDTAQESLLAGYRPCKRCKPMAMPGEASEIIQTLIQSVENDPTHRWREDDVRRMGYDPSTVRRQFKKRFGMTFVGYARARRMGIALKSIREGDKVIEAQIDAAYESGSGFRDAFTKILGEAPANAKHKAILKAEWIETPIGPMIAMADDEALHLLEFTDRRGLEKEIETLRSRYKIAIVPGRTPIIDQITKELSAYFKGELQHFETPLKFYGSAFQQSVLHELLSIPYGTTRSYLEQAINLGDKKAVRAVARGNGMNQLAIIIPCHRVIGSDGSLTGYAGGLPRKKWLLDHEKAYQKVL